GGGSAPTWRAGCSARARRTCSTPAATSTPCGATSRPCRRCDRCARRCSTCSPTRPTPRCSRSWYGTGEGTGPGSVGLDLFPLGVLEELRGRQQQLRGNLRVEVGDRDLQPVVGVGVQAPLVVGRRRLAVVDELEVDPGVVVAPEREHLHAVDVADGDADADVLGLLEVMAVVLIHRELPAGRGRKRSRRYLSAPLIGAVPRRS